MNFKNKIIQASYAFISNEMQADVQIKCDEFGKIAKIGQNLTTAPDVTLENTVSLSFNTDFFYFDEV